MIRPFGTVLDINDVSIFCLLFSFYFLVPVIVIVMVVSILVIRRQL